ncbi:MAG: hypothetical protein ACLTYN_14365 [Dysosmobacter welbionis]
MQEVDYRGIRLREFDLDGALARRPQLILVDELAHSNAPGCRHQAVSGCGGCCRRGSMSIPQ